MSVSTRLKQYLDENGVKYVTIVHSSAYTAQEIAEAIHVRGKDLAKPVLLRTDGGFRMAVLPGPRRVDLDAARAALGARELCLAAEEEFKDLFPDCEPGAEPPFGNLYGVPVLVDERLTRDEEIVFNAGTHVEAVRMRYEDYARLVNPQVASFSR